MIAGPEIQPRADSVPLDDAEKAHVAARLVDFEVAAILRKGRGREQTAAALARRAFGEVEQSFGAGNGLVGAWRRKLEEAGMR